ncbi:transcriptional regulator [Asanoa ferruginea]|nr:transcriptional regulator [Asanoa ferruginea]
MRREELAVLAGLSPAYYTRLEQGRAPNVSDQVLTAVCRALSLDAAERNHVWRLARPAPATESAGSDETLRPQLRMLLDALSPAPALVLGRDRHLLAWNRTAHAIHAPHLDPTVVDDPATRPWWPELLFCDERVGALFLDWESKARDTVADLRGELGRRPEGDRLAALTGDLRVRSGPFAELWAEYPITACAHHDRVYKHPVVGLLELHDEFLELSDDPSQRLALFAAVPASPSARAIEQLANLSTIG